MAHAVLYVAYVLYIVNRTSVMYHSVTLTGPADHAIPYHSLAPSQPVLSETLYSETVLTFQLVVMPPVLG